MPKHSIGDLLVHETTMEELKLHWDTARNPQQKAKSFGLPKAYKVCSIFVETCHGGCTQIEYAVEGGDGGRKRWSESAVVTWSEALEVLTERVNYMEAERIKEKEAQEKITKALRRTDPTPEIVDTGKKE